MKEKKKKPFFAGYARYSSAAIQMGLIIFIGVWGGIKLDKLWGTSPLFTVIGSLLFIALGTYIAIKDVLPKK
ncbi:MAG: AtpZ/AtpI family protein [Bacteroidales bacterium]|nr:AtpZ/AtpI family protein [Bacteroidales bacterium]HHT51806.1 AtpZ/AtpI family protein [Bacteroidales bacterium]